MRFVLNDEIIGMLAARDHIAYADIIDTLGMEGSEILHFSESGIAVLNPSSTLMAASFSSDASWIAPFLDARLIAAHGIELYGYLQENGYRVEEPCFLYVYEGNAFNDTGYDIRPLDMEYAEKAASFYHDELGYISSRIAAGRLWGIFSEGELAGFGGFHEEGAMGMLEILPDFRRHSFGERLERFLIDKAIEEGRTAYCNVYASNAASSSLQRKLGLACSAIMTWWMWKE